MFGGWNKGRLNSYLIEITAEVLAADDPGPASRWSTIILDRAGQKGTGRWSVIEAQTARRAGHRDRGGGRRTRAVGA